MELPSGVFRQQQRWAPNHGESSGNGRLVAHNYKTTSITTSPTNLKKNLKFNQWPPIKQRSSLVSIKSKLGVEYRRYAILREDILRFDDFFKKVESIHQLHGNLFTIYYADQDGDLLPINNDDNLAKAIDATTRLKSVHHIVAANNTAQSNFIQHHPHQAHSYQYQQQLQSYQYQPMQQVIIERPYLKLFLETKEGSELLSLSKCKRKDNLINMLIHSSANSSSDSRPRISMPEDFRQVASIINADILPATRRRVVLNRGSSDKPLGFYIRDGTYLRKNSQGIFEKNYGIFISRLVPGGLAESTNLLAENDEILEVNGIEVGKSKRLDQVRDMMVANSSHLIITTRPAKLSDKYNAYNYNRLRAKNMFNFTGRDRLPSTQSNNSDLNEDFIRHHMN